MKIIYYLLVFFGIGYAVLTTHYLGFDRAKKAQDIQASASRIKNIEPSLSFRQKQYKEFVYAY